MPPDFSEPPNPSSRTCVWQVHYTCIFHTCIVSLINPSTQDLIARWLRRFGPSTRAQYGAEVRRFLRSFGRKSLTAIEPSHVRGAVEGSASHSSRQRVYTAISGFLDFANQQGIVKSNPARAFRLRDVPALPPFDVDEILALLGHDGFSPREVAGLSVLDVVCLLCRPPRGPVSTYEKKVRAISARSRALLSLAVWRLLRKTRASTWQAQMRRPALKALKI